ncbi:MAG TPA: hypothetical protein DCE39_18820 [Planctomycetaceae bacterium]|nr:hypothetical protein [Planctomycetaceae bacterium]
MRGEGAAVAVAWRTRRCGARRTTFLGRVGAGACRTTGAGTGVGAFRTTGVGTGVGARRTTGVETGVGARRTTGVGTGSVFLAVGIGA